MKKLLAALALAWGISGCGPNDTPVVKPGTMEALVEREIRKNDFWVERTIERDPDKKGSKVRLCKYPQEEAEKSGKMGIIGALGYYDKQKNMLLIPEGKDVFEVLDSIDHELSHAAFHQIILRGEYSGPSLDEIKEYCTKKTSSPEFETIKKTLQLLDYLTKANLGIKAVDNYASSGGILDLRINDITMRMDISKENIANKLTSEEKEKMSAVRKKFSDMLATTSQEYAALRERCRENSKDLTNKIKDDCLDQKIDAFRKICGDIKQLYEKLNSGLNEYAEKTYEYIGIADERNNAEMIQNLQNLMKKAETEKEKKSLQNMIDTAADMNKVTKGMDLMSARLDGIEQLGTEIVSAINTTSISEITGSPTEVLARIIDAMYSIYLGPVTDTKFTPTEDDLKFLERFEYCGNKMFEKGISKYRLARQMANDGIAHEEIKKKLEYATSFEYKGKKFSWPASRFRIKGEFQYEK